ncbi:hypothetical protein D3C71_1422600 [compost metagenome]
MSSLLVVVPSIRSLKAPALRYSAIVSFTSLPIRLDRSGAATASMAGIGYWVRPAAATVSPWLPALSLSSIPHIDCLAAAGSID